ncbi:response regulator [Dehalogenimonas sp. 4OHTPN]|uniref:Response regulator n=1 Tax=Dehalogenimonas sp. 4OHTPN TaxID=3166643 RepID=A0AAU8GBY1_9CHLR
MNNSLRVLVADGDPQVCSALKLFLEQQPDTLVSVAGRADEAVNLAAGSTQDIILLDWQLACKSSGGGFIHELRRLCPGAAVIAMSARPEARQAALNGGADRFFSKNDNPCILLNSLGRLAGRKPADCPSR